MKKLTILAIIIILIVGVILLYPSDEYVWPSNFEECVDQGGLITESYPRGCIVKGASFVEVIEDAWRLDNIELRRHETEGYYGCFGCGKTLCVDPIFEMKFVEETDERYCNEDFEVVENGEAVERYLGEGDEGEEVIDDDCGVENCHGPTIECGPEVVEACTAIFLPGDQCRRLASCGTIGGQCQVIENQEYLDCVSCVESCGDDVECVAAC